MNIIKLTLTITLIMAMVSCNSDDDSTNSPSAVENIVKTGTWRITRFEDSGSNETALFSGYAFVFDANRTLTATNGSILFVGTWSVTGDRSDDDSSDDMDFNINFNANNVFDELSEDWHFVSFSASKIELIHVSGGNGGTDYLTFERN